MSSICDLYLVQCDRRDWARVWKSIIRSSTGGTAYPYCTYIRTLSLGNSFENVLDEINVSRDASTRSWLFDAEDNMESFLALRESNQPTRRQFKFIDQEKTTIRCAESITAFIKNVADETATAVALAHLEAYHIPISQLPIWISRLGTLTSLTIRDGSVLGVEAASAITTWCPKFCDLTCYYCHSETADEDMAAFLQTLRPNCLQRFEVISMNRLGERTLTAFNAHAESLRSLKLGSLSGEGMKCLNALPNCTALETLAIENIRHEQLDLRAFSEGLLKEITNWIQNCRDLRDLTLENVKDALLIVKDVLLTDDIQLWALSLQGFTSQGAEHDAATWTALGKQSSMEALTLGNQDGAPDNLVIDSHSPLAASICQLQNLESLNLIRAVAGQSEVIEITRSLPRLVEFKFAGLYMDDTLLDHLGLPDLRDLAIGGPSFFTWQGLKNLALRLGERQSSHRGIRIDVLNQASERKLSDEQVAWLSTYFRNTFDGTIAITLDRDPDEQHEGDFSDDSD